MVYRRTCKICGKDFPALSPNTKYCSDECKKKGKAQHQHKYYMAHREHILEQNKKWKQAHKEECNEYYRKWRKNNPDKARAQNHRAYQKHRKERLKRVKDWQRENPDKVKQNCIKWERENPDKVKAKNERNKARKYRIRHNITESYCIKHNDCLNCPYPYEVCLHE